MSQRSIDDDQALDDLKKDLSALRQRGLHNLEDKGGLSFRRLELLAREFTADQPDLRRDEAIRSKHSALISA